MRWVSAVFAVLTAFAGATASASDEWMDRLEERLTFSAWDDTLRARLSGLLSLEGYSITQPAPGLLFTSSDRLFNPRLAVFLNAQVGPRLFGFVQARVDRGFDPSNERLRVRLDEYAVTYIPWADTPFNVQVGQFATVIGNWMARHDSWENPFINAPLPYENQTSIYDTEAPLSGRDFATFEPGEKYEYNPVIWGPSYATGAAIAGRRGRFELAVEVKNSGPSSRPELWSIEALGFGRPAYAARLGFRPDLRWKLGISASDSVYFAPGAEHLPPGTSRHDFRQRLLGQDIGFAWRHLQVWAELFQVWFEVPRVGTVRTIAGYAEVKYKFTPRVFGALRWNRQGFSSIDDGAGNRVRWGNSLWRTDLSAGYRFTSRTIIKVQASSQREATQRERLRMNYAAQFNLRF